MSKNNSFSKNYKILKDTAEKLKNQSEPDIDGLVPMIESATDAYKECKARIDTVKQILEKHMPADLDIEDK